MKNKLNKMNHKEFTEYLKSNNIDFREVRDWDLNTKDYIQVIPKNRKFKARMFLETRVTKQVKV